MKIGEKIYNLRKAQGMTQEELAEKLDVTRQTVSKWETNQTYPELDKAEKLSTLFGISLDELVGRASVTIEQRNIVNNYPFLDVRYPAFEYKSKWKIGNIPLVHICFGKKKIAKGIVAIGIVSMGGISIGCASAGIFSIGPASIGLLLSIGAISVSPIFAIGGVAIGAFALGGIALGKYAIGGIAVATDVAVGGLARAHIAIGNEPSGEHIFETTRYMQPNIAAIQKVILQEFPKIPKTILRFILSASKG